MVDQEAPVPGGQDDLLRQAVAILQMRYERQTSYTELSPSAVAELSNILESVATDEDGLGSTDRGEAVALAHRLVDDDHPELSPMWPHPSA